MQDTQRFINSLDGVHKATVDVAGGEHHYIEIAVDATHYEFIEGLFDESEWTKEWDEPGGGLVTVRYTRPIHGIDSMCFLTPHVVSDVDGESINDFEPGEEETSQGYFRQVSWIECKCGKHFDGCSAFNEYKEHL